MKSSHNTYPRRTLILALALAAGATACGESNLENDSLRTDRSVNDMSSRANESATQPDRANKQSEAEQDAGNEFPKDRVDAPHEQNHDEEQAPASSTESATYITGTSIVGRTAVLAMSNDSGAIDTWTLSCEDKTTLNVASERQDDKWSVYSPELCSDGRLTQDDTIVLNQLIASD